MKMAEAVKMKGGYSQQEEGITLGCACVPFVRARLAHVTVGITAIRWGSSLKEVSTST